jgi:polysaccharide export outer membrane protein
MIKFMPSWHRYQNKTIFCSTLFVIFVFLFSSCRSIKSSYYFGSLKRDTSLSYFVNQDMELKIQKKDELNISVSSLNGEEDMLFSSAQMNSGSSGVNGPAASESQGAKAATQSPGIYQVDSSGDIKIHKLGMLHVEGMVLKELANKLENDLLPYLKDPIVSVTFANHKVTVLGEVRGPQVLSIQQNSLTLFDALAKCGDVTSDASKKDVLIIRDSANTKQFKHINLENLSVFNSSYYYLQANDIVYVNSNVKKVESQTNRANTQQTMAIGISAVSLMLVLLTTFRK